MDGPLAGIHGDFDRSHTFIKDIHLYNDIDLQVKRLKKEPDPEQPMEDSFHIVAGVLEAL